MKSFTGYKYKDDVCYKKRDGLGDDKSRAVCGSRPMCSTTPKKACGIKKNNTTRMNRFQRLIHGNVEFPEPPCFAWVSCDLCACAKKVQLWKILKPKQYFKVTDCFDPSCIMMSDHPRMQQRFDHWVEFVKSRPSFDIDKSNIAKLKPKRKEPPKHRCRHPLNPKMIDYWHPEFENIPPKVEVVRCDRCPEPYRPWIRKDKADHIFRRWVFQYPFGKSGADVRPTWTEPYDIIKKFCNPSYSYFQRMTYQSIQNPYDLKPKLRMILKKEHII